MPAKIRESVVERQLVKFAKEMGCLSFKFVSPGNRGVPDRIFIKNGKVLFMEIKQKGKEPNPLQEHQMQQIRKQKVMASWADDFEDGKLLIWDTLLT